MNDQLEKFIEDNREEFDAAIPSVKVWEQVAVAVTMKKKKPLLFKPLFKWSIAASLLLIMGTGIYFLVNKGRSVQNGIPNTETRTEIPDAPPEMNQFALLIAMKQEELRTLGKEQPELYRQFASDINQLDSSYKALKSQLSVTPNREMLIEAMIQNLQLQLNVLNQQLNIIHQIKQSKKYSHEKNDQTI